MIADARAALHRLLLEDPQFTADIAALNLGTTGKPAVPQVLPGNRRFEQVPQEKYPCWHDDAGDQQGGGAGTIDGDSAGLTIGSHCQGWVGEILLALVWHQQDYDTSVAQTDGVHPALVRLMLRNPSLDETCTWAYLARTDNDRGVRHPTHVAQFVVRVHYDIERGPA
ncbi:hypothetical protein [Stenotrophomonas sp. MMGLT7]|uniref:hypothetical protein n=1 Tax=Stenotrophomonas sp. MMGLT7 TaxID=2901227 RepID=UPI001E30489F|nr:hypothetical protein [Stenotrophomonas sp. MMGLT7]MCD7096938.1 hypothetical protein [Stenotrophomonas sp. MMGLT7]